MAGKQHRYEWYSTGDPDGNHVGCCRAKVTHGVHGEQRCTFCGEESQSVKHEKMSSPIPMVHRCTSGEGNAAIRPFQCHPHWQAAGVPTGTYKAGVHHKGYSVLDIQVVTAVGHSASQIEALLATGRFDTLAFSYDPATKLGGRIFNTAQPVRDYIYDQLVAVAEKSGVELLKSKFMGEGKDGDFSYMITRKPETLFVFNDNEEEFYAHFSDPANPHR